MLQFKKHHVLLLVLIAAFLIAWGVWTLWLTPASEAPLSAPPPTAPATAPAP